MTLFKTTKSAVAFFCFSFTELHLETVSKAFHITVRRLAFVADFGTRNFNFKNKFDMENKTSINHENGNDANRLLAAVKNWWYKGEGGEWYEPYVTNGDVVICCSIGIVGGFIIAAGCCLL